MVSLVHFPPHKQVMIYCKTQYLCWSKAPAPLIILTRIVALAAAAAAAAAALVVLVVAVVAVAVVVVAVVVVVVMNVYWPFCGNFELQSLNML